MRLLVGPLGGAVIAFLVATALIPPNREDIVAAAEEFVPPGVTGAKVEPLTGSPLIVGHDFYVIVDIQGAREGAVGLAQGLVDEATGNGWDVVATGRLGPMRTYGFARWPMTAEARVGSDEARGEPTETGTAHVPVEEDADAIFRAIPGISVLGAAAGVGAALLLGRIVMAGSTQGGAGTNLTVAQRHRKTGRSMMAPITMG